MCVRYVDIDCIYVDCADGGEKDGIIAACWGVYMGN